VGVEYDYVELFYTTEEKIPLSRLVNKILDKLTEYYDGFKIMENGIKTICLSTSSLRSSILTEETGVDMILDKISKEGVVSLTYFEKWVLENATPNESIEDCVKKWLDSYFSGLREVEESHMSFGKVRDFIYLVNEKDEWVFQYDKDKKEISIPYYGIIEKLEKHYEDEIFKEWAAKEYGFEIKSITPYFDDQF
jgi:hypothetical protein